ncbi:MAG: hypothetical protein ACQESA_00070 [Patescibacteria group bacterium]
MSISEGLFFIPLILLILFLIYKKTELYLGTDFAFSRYIRSYDLVLREFFIFIREFVFTFKGKVSLFFLTRVVYPMHRVSRRTKFRLSTWYFRFLDRLRERHMARYRNETSLYLRTISWNTSQNKSVRTDEKASDNEG